MYVTQVSSSALRRKLGQCLARVENGEVVIICRRGKRIALLLPHDVYLTVYAQLGRVRHAERGDFGNDKAAKRRA